MNNSGQEERHALNTRVAELRAQGICPTCHSLAADQPFGGAPIVYENERFQVTLERFPRMRGHTIVLYKPHRDDLSAPSADETAAVFQLCVRVMNAIKQELGADKVYLNTMCDGAINHLHLQLFPRYPGDPIGSTRFVAPRGPLLDGDETARRIRAALSSDDPNAS